MNKIITETTFCGFCKKDAPPITSDNDLYCPLCRLPHFPGLEYLPDAAPATGIFARNAETNPARKNKFKQQ